MKVVERKDVVELIQFCRTSNKNLYKAGKMDVKELQMREQEIARISDMLHHLMKDVEEKQNV